jgi:LPXTG-motif cell wall-anchored protein
MFFAFVVSLTWAGPARAATAPPVILSVSDRTPAAGSVITFCGQGFQPGENINFILVGLEMQATADASGHFCTTFPLIREHGIVIAPGPLTLAVMGEHSGLDANIEIVIGPAVVPPAGQGELAATGTTWPSVAGVGGLLLVVGAMIFFAGRRRGVDLDG